MKQLRIIALVILEHGNNRAFSTGRLFQCFMKNLWEGCQLHKESLHFPLIHLSKVLLEITASGIFHVYKMYSYFFLSAFLPNFPLPPSSLLSSFFPSLSLSHFACCILYSQGWLQLSSSDHPSSTSQVLG